MNGVHSMESIVWNLIDWIQLKLRLRYTQLICTINFHWHYHLKSSATRGRRPVNNLNVWYEMEKWNGKKEEKEEESNQVRTIFHVPYAICLFHLKRHLSVPHALLWISFSVLPSPLLLPHINCDAEFHRGAM